MLETESRMSASAFEDALKAIKQIIDAYLEDKDLIKKLINLDDIEKGIALQDPVQ